MPRLDTESVRDWCSGVLDRIRASPNSCTGCTSFPVLPVLSCLHCSRVLGSSGSNTVASYVNWGLHASSAQLGRDVKNLLVDSVFLGEFLPRDAGPAAAHHACHDLAAASSTSLPCPRADGRLPTMGAPVMILAWAGTPCSVQEVHHCYPRGLDREPWPEPGREGPYISPAKNKQRSDLLTEAPPSWVAGTLGLGPNK
jgi:hypothetical protein